MLRSDPCTLFFGTPEFALPSAQACLDASELLGVVTQPDRPRGRGQKVSPCPVKEWALKHELPTFSPESLRKESEELTRLIDFIQEKEIELFAVTAYGNIIPEDFLKLPKKAAVNVHGSLLPRWRGAAPIQRALEAGDRSSGISLQKMVYELDAGDVLLEREMMLDNEVNAFGLSNRLSELGGSLLKTFLEKPKFEGLPQDPELVTYAKKIKKEEGYWQAHWSSRKTHNTVRAFVAWPGVKAKWASKDLKLLKTRLVEPEDSFFAQAKKATFAGKLHIFEKRVFLECCPVDDTQQDRMSEHYLELLEVQVAGKKAGSAYECFKNNPDHLEIEAL